MRITIITVSFNSVKTIENTILSVSMQNYEDVEHLVIDGQSTDGTIHLVRKQVGPKLRLISESDDGMYDAMNKGIRHASGEIIGILNSDDCYVHSNVLYEVVDAFLNDPSLDVVLGDVDFIDSIKSEKSYRYYSALGFKSWMFYFGLMPPHPGIFIRKTAYARIGLYKTNYKIAADFDLLLRLLKINGSKFTSTGKHWVRMLAGGVSNSGLISKYIITKEMKQSFRENNIYTNIFMLLLRLPIKFFFQINVRKRF